MKNIKTTGAPDPIGPYSQAILHSGFLFISGQIAIDPTTGEMRDDTLEMEFRQVMQNIGAILKEADTNYSNVIKCSIFLTDMDSFPEINKMYGSYFSKPFPARETVEVSRLPAGARVEISVIAALN